MDSASPFDPARVAAHRARAAQRFEDVLVARVAEDLAERADGVNRAFGATLAIGDAGRFRAAVAARSSLAKRINPLTEMDRVARLAPNGVVGDQEALPFAEGSFGLIVSTLSLHWANDIVGALIQARRALRPDGLLLASFFGGRTLTELRESLLVAESDVTGGASPRVAPFADVMDGANLLQRAGFALPVADTDIVTLRYREPLKLFADLRAMGETSALRARVRPLTREVIARAMAHYAERFSDADGRLRATFEIITLTGWAPHESQQKPLAPGSAKTRLADALSVKEISAGEAAPPPGRKTP